MINCLLLDAPRHTSARISKCVSLGEGAEIIRSQFRHRNQLHLFTLAHMSVIYN